MEEENSIALVLGTMTIGEQIFGSDVKDMIQSFLSSGYRELDTAYVYNSGECERLLGEVLRGLRRESFEIATKVNPRITGKLNREAVLTQANESLARLGVQAVDTLYLHFPDPNTPVESALEGCAQLYEEGKFRRLGLSNFPAWLVAEVHHICEKNGWMLPEVYEGLYNPLSRFAERELNQALTYYGMCFYAYNPLAGGMLTDKYSGKEHKLKEGRFTNRPNYQKRYWKDSYFMAVEHIREACIDCDINIVDASYRWLAYHSMLTGNRGDAIIVGASRIAQLNQNINTLSQGKLPGKVVTAIEDAWEICRSDAPEYFRYFSSQN